jgi:hypothetical protein
MGKILKIANAQAFWGDSPGAPLAIALQQPDLDYLTLDYLAEVSMSIMAIQREKDPQAGYARDFIDVIRSLAPLWKKSSKLKLVTNAGGLAPLACAKACAEALKGLGVTHLKIGVLSGDDVLELLQHSPDDFSNLESGETAKKVVSKLVTANAYLGARGICDLLQQGADIVITGRTADPSLTVGPCMAHFGWKWDDYNRIAQATVAGHLIECGTQVTGGISTDWLSIEDAVNIGFPIVEMSEDGSFIITKPKIACGTVTQATVKEQLLYEMGDPARYLSPDVTLSLLSITLSEEGEDRIRVKGALGEAPPKTYKVSATYRDGYKAEAFLAIAGAQVEAKARRMGEVLFQRVANAGFELERIRTECLGCGDLVPGVYPKPKEIYECVLRLAAADQRKEALECFSKEIASLVTSGAQGTTGYIGGRAKVRPLFGYWPSLVAVDQVKITTTILSP